MNKNLAIILLVLTCFAMDALALGPCSAYQCSANNLNAYPNATGSNRYCRFDTMATSKSQKYSYLQTCMPYGWKCQYNFNSFTNGEYYKCYQPQVPAPTPKLPGWRCSTNADCYSKNCRAGGWCQGLEEKEPCLHDTQCGLNLFCNQSLAVPVCTKVLKEGASCTYDNDAAPCQFDSECVSLKCIRKMSLPVGASVDGPEGYMACQSLTAENGKCVAPYKRVGPAGVMATQSPCSYSNQPDFSSPVVVGASSCGYSFNGYAVCAEGLGDSGALEYIANNYFALKPVCHIAEKSITACDYAVVGQGVQPNVMFNVSSNYLQNPTSDAFLQPIKTVPETIYLYDNSACTQELITYQFWDLFL